MNDDHEDTLGQVWTGWPLTMALADQVCRTNRQEHGENDSDAITALEADRLDKSAWIAGSYFREAERPIFKRSDQQ